MKTHKAGYQPFDDVRGKWNAHINSLRIEDYDELNKETAYRLTEEYCNTIREYNKRVAELRVLMETVMASNDVPPEIIRRIVDLFLNEEDKDLSRLPFPVIAMQGLMNPICPSDILSRACFCKNNSLAWAAELNPNLPEEDQVRCALEREYFS